MSTHEELSARQQLLQRYHRIWRQSWKRRKELDPPKRASDETQFLPAALALKDKPVHPAPRAIIWSIIAFFLLALIWACFSHIDVVATSTGKIVPSGKSKIIQASEAATVKHIYVSDGQRVKAGDVLIELDARSTQADVTRLQTELNAANVDIARANALLTAIETQQLPQLKQAGSRLSSSDLQSARNWLTEQYAEFIATKERVEAQIEQRQAEIISLQTSIDSMEKTLPITHKLVNDYKKLAKDEYIPQHAYLEKQQALLIQERELAVQRSRMHELQSAQKEAEKQASALTAQTRRAMFDLKQQATQRAASLSQELVKANQRNQLMKITSPVDGTVQQLAINTVQGVVTAAQALMVIVPQDQPLEVEAMLENKDIGFVHVGQSVEVKVDTFTFTKYGLLHGKITSISHDAIEDPNRGLLYSMRIELAEKAVMVDKQSVPLSPGMTVRAEVKINQRRVIDYFLSPLKRYANESLNER